MTTRASTTRPRKRPAYAQAIRRHDAQRLDCDPDGSTRLCLVADTHGNPHPRTRELLAEARPSHILHAGDIGDLGVLDLLGAVAPVVAVRGNIDTRAHGLPDAVDVDLVAGDRRLLRILLLHIALRGSRLTSDVVSLARDRGADMVVCGHSHVPFIGRDRGLVVFNPGSIGPRRFHLPITFGVLEVSPERIRPYHVSCETGAVWLP